MTLAAFQETMKAMMMTPTGRASMDSTDTLRDYLADSLLSTAQREDILAQPLPNLQQYAYMVASNVRDTLQSIYPFTHQVLSEDWETLTEDYLAMHPPRSFRLMEVATAFPDYLAEQANLLARWPFLVELAMYEWVEAELLSAPDVALPSGLQRSVPTSGGELATMSPVLNPVSTLLQLAYPIPELVSRLQAGEGPEVMLQNTMVLVYRDLEPPVCRYFILTPFLAAWLAMVQEAQHVGAAPTYHESLQPLRDAMAQQGEAPAVEPFDTAFLGALPGLYAQNILLGSLSR